MSLSDFFGDLFGKKKKKPDVSAKQLRTDFLKQVTVTAVEQEFRPAVGGKIMIFEDSQTWSSIMKKALENEGYTVFVFPDALKCVEMVKQHRPDLVLMDLNMPGLSGFEATNAIKARVENKPLPILILTSQNTPFDRMESMKRGARAFLSKDQPLEDIVVAIKAYMTNTALKSDISSIINLNKSFRKPQPPK